MWVCAAMLALPLAAQEPATSSKPAAGAVDPNVDRRTREWAALASGLEQKLLRLLPCDGRVRTSIDEVSRASDARFAALTAYWQGIAAKSKLHAAAARKALDAEQSSAGEWKSSTVDAEQESAGIAGQQSDLAAGAAKMPSLSAAKQTLDSIADASKQDALKAKDQEARAAGLGADLRDLVTADDALQSAVDAQIRALAAESQRWTAYYLARAGRAQMECAITNAGGDADSAPARRPPPRKEPPQ